MTVHLDTSFLIRALVHRSPEDGRLRLWLGEGRRLAMSAIAWAEFLCGPMHARDVELAARVVEERVAFLEEDAARAAGLFNQAGRRRGSLMDCMVAATALRSGASLATANPADFRRFASAGLEVLTA